MSRYRLPCDICDAKLPDRASFDEHMRDEHGTISLKPRTILGKIEAIRAALPDFPDEKSTGHKIDEKEAKEYLERLREKFKEDERLEEENRELTAKIEENILRKQFKLGWLTFRALPGDISGAVCLPWEMGEVKVNFIYHEYGSWIQFPSENMRDRYVAYLKAYLEDPETRKIEGTKNIEKIESIIIFAQDAEPWTLKSFKGRY